MRRALIAILKALFKLVLAVVLLLLLFAFGYIGWARWQTRQLRAFCDAVTPGLSLAQLAPLAEQHGFAAHWVHGPGIADSRSGDWVMFVPATSSMGEVVCEIHDDQQMVTSARFSGVDRQ